MLFIAVFMIVSMWKIDEKAGQPGWASIVPIYNIIVYVKIIKKPMWWIIIFVIPVVNYVFLIWSVNLLSKRFGKDVVFTIGLLLLGFVFYPILAFGDAKYKDDQTVSSDLLDN
jgi:hypothetical protein